MIRHPALGEIVGADSLVTHAGAHLGAAQAGVLGFNPLLLNLIELGGQHPHTLFAVLHLAALLLTGHHDARGLVDQPDGGAGFVDVLTAGTGCPVYLHLNVRWVNLHIHLFHLRQHRHGGGGGVNPAAGFGFRHPLHPVDAGFVFQPGIGTPAIDDKVRFLHAAQLGIVVVEQLHAPAHPGGVHGVHPEQAAGEQGTLLAAHAAPNLHDDAFFVIGILGQQQNLELAVQFFLPGLGFLIGFLAQILHLRVAHQLLGIVHVPAGG